MTTAVLKVYPVYSPHFWKAYFIQMRPYLLFVSGIAGLAGIAMANGESLPGWKIATAFIPLFLGYGFGQALTDCFQTDTDKLSAPYRPLSREIVSIKSVLFISIAGLLFCAVVLFSLHIMSFILSCFAVVGLATYSYIKRKFWWGGPFYNAWIVSLLVLMGYFAGASAEIKSFPLSQMPFVFVSFFSYANFVLIGYLKDIKADKATGYKTFPVVWGWQKTIFLGDIFALLTILFFCLHGNFQVGELVAAGLATIIIILGQVNGHRAKSQNEQEALIPILSTVRSFILFHIAIVLHFQPAWWAYMIVYYLLFEIFLFKRPSRYQV
jgi:4-hydroxybenzoate polyprenyltransferase